MTALSAVAQDGEEESCEFPLTADQVVPPSGSSASGTGLVADMGVFTVTLQITHTVQNPTKAAIYKAQAGQNGTEQYDLGAPASPINKTVWLGFEGYLDFIDDFYNGLLYVVIENASGQQIRGQMVCWEVEGEGDCQGNNVCPHKQVSHGGFECTQSSLYNSHWTQVSENFDDVLICDNMHCGYSGPAHQGNYFVYFYGYYTAETDYVQQSVIIPNVDVAGLGFYLWIKSGSGNGTDRFFVTIDGTQVFSVLENDMAYRAGYVQVTVDVSAFADGNAHMLRFSCTTAVESFGHNTVIQLDDICLVEGSAPPVEGEEEGTVEGEGEGQVEGEGQAEGEGQVEGEGSAEGEVEGEGQVEGEGEEEEGEFVEVWCADFETDLNEFVIDNDFGWGNGLWHRTDACYANVDCPWFQEGEEEGSGEGEDEGAPDLNFVLYYGQDSTCDYNVEGVTHQGVVTSPVIDLTNIEAPITLSYAMYVETAGNAPAEDLVTVEASINDGPFVVVDSNTDSILDPSYCWMTVAFNLDAAARSTLRLRFGFNSMTASNNAHPGFYLDDVCLGGHLPGEGEGEGTTEGEGEGPCLTTLTVNVEGCTDCLVYAGMIKSGSKASYSFACEEVVGLFAAAYGSDEEVQFDHWTGAVANAGAAHTTITMPSTSGESLSVTAVFVPVAGEGEGAVQEGEGGGEGEGAVQEGEGGGEGEGEGAVQEGEGGGEGEGEGAVQEGEGGGEGAVQEGEGATPEGQEEGIHTADQDGNHQISLSELLRVIQFFNSDGYHCQAGTEDGFAPGPGDHTCTPHNSDYNSQDWRINLSELLRIIQFFNSGGYHYCPEQSTEDGYCPGM